MSVDRQVKLFVIDSFDGGISDFYDRGPRGSFKFASGLDIRDKRDSISCSHGFTTIGSGVITDLILWLVPASDGNSYGFGDSGKIYKIDSSDNVTQVYDAGSKILGAAEWFNDQGDSFLYWVTSTSLHRKKLGTGVWTDVDATVNGQTYPKTDLDSATWHTMVEALGELMIANNDKVAMVGYDDSYTKEALLLTPSQEVTALLERDNLLLVGTKRTDQKEAGYLFTWETTALSWLQKRKIPTKGINAMIDTEMTLMQGGDNGDIYFSDLANVMPITQFPSGGQVNPDGVDSYKGMALFGVFGGDSDKTGIYTFGRKAKNAKIALNLDYPITADEIGSVKVINGEIYVSYKSGSSYYLKKVVSTSRLTGVYESLELEAPSLPPTSATLWKHVRVYMDKLPSGCSVSCEYQLDRSGTWVDAELMGDVATFSTANGTDAIFNVGANAKIFQFKLTLTPSGTDSPKINKVEVAFI